jgi:hypothetical protein
MIRVAAVACLVALPVAAGTLDNRRVTFTVMTWDDPATPYLQAQGRTVTVGAGVEFGLEPEGLVNGLEIVPALVQIGPTRVEITYPAAGQGYFFDATFNGYVLRFETDCALFTGWSVDQEATSLPVTEADIFTDQGALYINVAGLAYSPSARLAVDLTVADCPLS